ncbi:transmembrane emp24 domain-containing protein, putative [Plasmodium malariae]|uniref:Transmembrane emp24 domain-containing protein, putative n=1 Tax=Plasmodium malariae TaxID=5858 RepID=A0A1A8VRH6_PLAMA|nr:transmembrane emp24 domain-containing protein, putative [Plasmodium malariae]SBS83119.1 transmembrane emp24 domain-containing protein, putative [Plasmodium malariae]SBT87525.1 transmembrane emp24 domain-containing protein, putative [Plasmodium malariae]
MNVKEQSGKKRNIYRFKRKRTLVRPIFVVFLLIFLHTVVDYVLSNKNTGRDKKKNADGKKGMNKKNKSASSGGSHSDTSRIDKRHSDNEYSDSKYSDSKHSDSKHSDSKHSDDDNSGKSGKTGSKKYKNKKKRSKDNKKISVDDHFGQVNEEDTNNNIGSEEDHFMEDFSKFEKNFHQDLQDEDGSLDYMEDESEYGENEHEIPDNPNIDENSNDMKPNANDYQYHENDDIIEPDDELTNMWNKNMQNFEPSTLLTFEIPGNSEDFLFEEILKPNTYFRGVFYSNNESEDNKIEFLISDPDSEIIFRKEASEGIFYFYTVKTGVYTITLRNNKWVGKKLTTVALGLGENPSLKSDDIKSFTNYIDKILSETRKLKNEIKYLSSKHMSHMHKMKKITNKAFLYCFIKLFVLIFLSLFTIYYIKNLVMNKRVL